MKYQSQTFAGSVCRVLSVGQACWTIEFMLPTVSIDGLFEDKPLSVMSTGRPNRVGDRFCHHFKLEGSISSELKFEDSTVAEAPLQPRPGSDHEILYSGIYPHRDTYRPMALPFGSQDMLFGYRGILSRSRNNDVHIKCTIRPAGPMRFVCVRYVLDKIYDKNTLQAIDASGYAWVYYYYPFKYSSKCWRYRSVNASTASVEMPDPGVEVVDNHDFSFMDSYVEKVATNLARKEYDALDSVEGLEFYPYNSYDCMAASSVPVDPSIVDVATWIKRANAVPSPSEREWQELAYEAVQNANYVAINSIAYIRDLPELFGELKALRQVLGDPKDPKAWASLILSANYGTRLTIHDTAELINAIIRAARSAHKADKRQFATLRSRSGYSVTGPGLMSGHRELHYKIYHKRLPNEATSIVDSLYRWDLLPTAGNIWDLIPYSFVIDWFVNIGDGLELADATLYAQTLDVLGITYSYKDTFQLPPSVDGFVINDGQLTVYHRMLANRISLPSYSLELNQGYQNNIIQGGSLLIQRMK